MLTIDPELEITLEALAEQEHSSPNEIIKRLINQYISQKQAKEKKKTENSEVSDAFLQLGIEAAERETAYLLQSATMKQRLLAAKERKSGIELGVVCEKLGI